MIKINFLNSFKDYAAAQGMGGVAVFDEDERNKILIDIAKRLVILSLGPLGLYIYEAQTIPVLNQKKSDFDAKYAELKAFNDGKQGLAEEIKRYDLEQERFNAQMDFITKIQTDKLNEYKLFRHLKDSTPLTVWVNSLELRDNILNISGESVDPADITQFIEKLSSSDFIVNLVPMRQQTKQNYLDSGVDTTIFEVKATLKAGVVK